MFNAAMQFDLGEDVGALRDMAHRWAQERVRPMAKGIDAANAFPPELWEELGGLGLLGMTVDDKYGGTGLGLSVSKTIVELHGGSLQIRNSEPPGICAQIILRAATAVVAGRKDKTSMYNGS